MNEEREYLPLNGITITQAAVAFAQRAVAPLMEARVRQLIEGRPKLAGLTGLLDPGEMAEFARMAEQHSAPLINAYLGGALAAVSWLANREPDQPGQMSIQQFQEQFDAHIAALQEDADVKAEAV